MDDIIFIHNLFSYTYYDLFNLYITVTYLKWQGSLHTSLFKYCFYNKLYSMN